ncbi:MAG TPA: hypothetical protein DHU79_05755 [Clostridiales bacterium]|nr:hypothetical protein [Clostridiales bacterium]
MAAAFDNCTYVQFPLFAKLPYNPVYEHLRICTFVRLYAFRAKIQYTYTFFSYKTRRQRK